MKSLNDKSGEKGLIFNIQRFSIHDGPGIRTTVFMKGCPLKCLWCSNPESQDFSPNLIVRDINCKGCGECIKVCPKGAITITEGEYDAMSVYQMFGSKYPAISIRSASTAKKDLIENMDYLDSYDRIYLCFDNDGAGQTTAFRPLA